MLSILCVTLYDWRAKSPQIVGGEIRCTAYMPIKCKKSKSFWFSHVYAFVFVCVCVCLYLGVIQIIKKIENNNIEQPFVLFFFFFLIECSQTFWAQINNLIIKIRLRPNNSKFLFSFLIFVSVYGRYWTGGVGKSSLVLRFIKGTFRESYIPTIEDTYRQVSFLNFFILSSSSSLIRSFVNWEYYDPHDVSTIYTFIKYLE